MKPSKLDALVVALDQLGPKPSLIDLAAVLEQAKLTLTRPRRRSLLPLGSSHNLCGCDLTHFANQLNQSSERNLFTFHVRSRSSADA